MNAVVRTEFEGDYWVRFYTDPETRVTSQRKQIAEAAWLMATLKERLGIEIGTAMDYGSGLGWFAGALDFWGDLQTFRYDPFSPDPQAWRDLDERADAELIVCRDVLYYMTDVAAENALRRFCQSRPKAMYIRVSCAGDQLTPESDSEIHLRSRDWYHARIKGFVHLAFGLFIRADLPVDLQVFEQ